MLYSNFLTLNLLKINELYFCHVPRMNLAKLLKIADQYAVFCALFKNYCFVSNRSVKNQFSQTKNLVASQTNQKYLYLTSSAT